jgi:ribosomal protein S12 methylthiotransferase accessory factor
MPSGVSFKTGEPPFPCAPTCRLPSSIRVASPDRADLPARPLQRSWGVTRIGRLTGLDRIGLEVACAVRPRGHVLQSSNGKGWSFREAAAAALSEAAELEASENPDPTLLRWATTAQMRRRFGDDSVWDPQPWIKDPIAPRELALLRLAWVEGQRLGRRSRVWIPAAAVYCPTPGGFGLAPVSITWTSNGIAAHPRRAPALRHALLELVERDGLARVLPQGWTARAVGEAWLHPGTLARVSPRAAHQVSKMADASFETHFFIWPRGGVGGVPLPLAAALIFDEPGSPVPLTAGYGCRPTLRGALESALQEAAQSRLTDIHGAREDIRPMPPAAVLKLRRWCNGAKKKSVAVVAAPGVPFSLSLFKRAGHGELAVVPMAADRPGLHVLRVLSRTMQLTELL